MFRLADAIPVAVSAANNRVSLQGEVCGPCYNHVPVRSAVERVARESDVGR